MNKLLITLAMLLTGCASNMEADIKRMHAMDAFYCQGAGIQSYSELQTLISVTCEDNRYFMVEK